MSGPYEKRENESQAEVIWHQTHITKDHRACLLYTSPSPRD